MLKPQNPRPYGLNALEELHKENRDRIAKALERADAKNREKNLELKTKNPKSQFNQILQWLMK